MNKPVAWIDKNTGKPRMEGFIKTDYDIPLYTHPANLTDEEIDLVWKITPSYEDRPDHINFARAILRKAQDERK